mmetsp:Transcript_4280/g.13584  ORF Transcript_4280/g.13584 Transcript_4280/m.13584 type:complete len:85 (+) Transcript_4280:1254-1508(+)
MLRTSKQAEGTPSSGPRPGFGAECAPFSAPVVALADADSVALGSWIRGFIMSRAAPPASFDISEILCAAFNDTPPEFPVMPRSS